MAPTCRVSIFLNEVLWQHSISTPAWVQVLARVCDCGSACKLTYVCMAEVLQACTRRLRSCIRMLDNDALTQLTGVQPVKMKVEGLDCCCCCVLNSIYWSEKTPKMREDDRNTTWLDGRYPLAMHVATSKGLLAVWQRALGITRLDAVCWPSSIRGGGGGTIQWITISYGMWCAITR